MSVESYNTLADSSTSEVREKSSLFIGHAFPIADEEAFKTALSEIAKAHHSARHICYGRVLGNAGEQYRSFDAGEPSGSAGKPILRQLQGASLTWCAIVVVRYFGGTLLGKAGLSHAFAAAAKEALSANTVVVRHVLSELEVECGYELVEEVKRQVLLHEGTVLHAEFTNKCALRVAVPVRFASELKDTWERKGVLVKGSAE